MHDHRLHLPHITLHQLSTALSTVMVGAGVAARFLLLSAIACFLLAKPISLREVVHASHRPAPRS